MRAMIAMAVAAGCAKQTTPTSPTGTTPFIPPGSGVITLETRDGVALEADYYPRAEAGPGLVLLHMIPPGNDRTNWPASFVEAMFDLGYTVINVDRRGAGGSEGEAVEAYEGPKGKNDVEAAVLRLTEDGYGPTAIIGASNGTTSMVDYAVWAPGEGLPAPVALGFMTGGTYTENQNAMEALPDVPAVFTFSTAERAWSEDQRALDPGGWVFHEYADGDHGPRMFDAAPEVTGDLAAFFGPFAAGG